MRVTLHSLLPAQDAAQRALFDSPVKTDPAEGTIPVTQGAAVYPGGHFRSETHVARRLAHLDGRIGFDPALGRVRAGLQEFLRHENAFAPLAPEQRANLDAAASPAAVFMLTGQQPGLLGGPILWYYKALTCAALAREWSARLKRPVIPVFWVAGDDSDLDECNHVELLDRRAADAHGDLRLPFPEAYRQLAMGERRVDPAAFADLLKRLGAIWGPEAADTLRRAYPVPSTLSSGFLRLAQAQLGREGILFVDGYSRNLRALSRPVLERAIAEREAWQARLRQGTAAAEAAGIPAQVELREGVVHAFALRAGERHRLFGERKQSRDTLYTPDRPGHDLGQAIGALELTHDVFSRPLVADRIFPVLGHVLGPAELRYFAQMAPLFLAQTGDMPLVHPRMTAAIAPSAAFEEFRAEGFDVPEAVRFGPASLRVRLSERAWQAHPASAALTPALAEKWFAAPHKLHARFFRDAGPMERFEREAAAAWKRYLRSMERAQYAAIAPAKRALFDHLRWLGNGMGQDRHLGLGSLLSAIGREGFDALRAAVDPTAVEMQLLKYGGE
jgi:hypothetical protein